MDETKTVPNGILDDGNVELSLSVPEILARGYRPYERYHVTLKGADGAPVSLTRDVLRGGTVVGVLPIDPLRREVVLIRQFRLAAHLGTGKGELVEIVAGQVESDESLVGAARRECLEEIGVVPSGLVELFSFFPSPGVTDERATIFFGIVDASQVPERAGAVEELEETRPLRIGIDAAIAAFHNGQVSNGLAIISLQWLALNQSRLAEILARAV